MGRLPPNLIPKPMVDRQLVGIPVKNCTPLDKSGAKTVPVIIDWAAFGASSLNPNVAVSVNLIGPQVTQSLDSIRTVYIDNTFSNNPIYVFFPDTNHTITCPPNAVTMQPALTNNQLAVIYGEGFVTGDLPVTTVHFMNFDRPGFYVPVGYDNSVTKTLTDARVDANAPASLYNFSNVRIGAALPNRIAVVCVGGFNQQAEIGNPTVSGAILGGIPLAQIAATNYLGNDFTQFTWIGAAKIPPTIGAVAALLTLATNITCTGLSFAVYMINNQDSDARYDAQSGNQNIVSQGQSSILLNEIIGAAGMCVATSPTTVIPMTGATTDAIFYGPGGSVLFASFDSLVSNTRQVSYGATCLSGVVWN